MGKTNICQRELNLDRVTILSVGFLFLFIAFNSAANISAQALENNGFGGLGFYTMATLYLVYALCSLFSSFLVNKLGDKSSLFLSGLCYAFWIFCFLPAAFYPDNKDSSSFIFNRTFINFLSLFSAAVNGFGSSVLWVAQGKYVGECANDQNKGFFFGYFWAFFTGSQIFGNLFAALILGPLSQSTYYIVMTIVAVSGSSVFLFLLKPLKSSNLAVDTDFLINEEEQSQFGEETSFTQNVKETFQLLISPRMLYFLPVIVWQAFSLATYSGSFVPLMNAAMEVNHPDWNDNKQLSMALFAMIPLGFGEIIGALLMGKISDKWGYHTSLKVLLGLTLVAFALLFGIIAMNAFNPLTFVMTFVWGLQDSSLTNFVNCILAFEFDSKVTPWSVFNFVQSLFIFAFLVIASYIDDQTKYNIQFGVMCIFAIVSLSMMLGFSYKAKK